MSYVDYLSAILVSMAVGVLLLVIMQNARETNIDATKYYASKSHALHIMDTIQRDVRNLGAGVPDTDAAILSRTGDDPTTLFQFYATVDTATTADPILIQYRLSEAEGPCPEATCYHFTREVAVDGAFVAIGGGNNILTQFRITLLDENNVEVVTLDDARIAEIEMQAWPAMGRTADDAGSFIPTHWNTQIRLLNMYYRE